MDFKLFDTPVCSRQCSTEESPRETQSSILPSQQSIVYDEVGFTPEESNNGTSIYTCLDVNYDAHAEGKDYGLTSAVQSNPLQINVKNKPTEKPRRVHGVSHRRFDDGHEIARRNNREVMVYGSSTSYLDQNIKHCQKSHREKIKRRKPELGGASRRAAIRQPDYIVFQRDIQRDSQPRRYGGPLIVQSQENDSPVTKTSYTNTSHYNEANSRGGWIKRDQKKVRVFEDIDCKGNVIVGEEVPFSSEDEEDEACVEDASSAKKERVIAHNECPKYAYNNTILKTTQQNLQNIMPVKMAPHAGGNDDYISTSSAGSIESVERLRSIPEGNLNIDIEADTIVPNSLVYSSDESIVENSLDPDNIVREHIDPVENKKTKRRGAYKKRKIGTRIKSFKSEYPSQECSINLENGIMDDSIDNHVLQDNTYIGNYKRRKRRRKVQQDISDMFSRESFQCKGQAKSRVRRVNGTSPGSSLRTTRRRKKSKLALNNSARKKQITTLDKFVLKRK